jgi:hypothetical protein
MEIFVSLNLQGLDLSNRAVYGAYGLLDLSENRITVSNPAVEFIHTCVLLCYPMWPFNGLVTIQDVLGTSLIKHQIKC